VSDPLTGCPRRNDFALSPIEKHQARAALRLLYGTGLSLKDAVQIGISAKNMASGSNASQPEQPNRPGLNEADLTAISELIDAKLIGKRFVGPVVMNVDEAMAYVGCRSRSVFNRWSKKWSVWACSRGRYARTKLDLGLDRESRGAWERRKRD